MIRRGRGMLAVVRTTGRRKSLVQPTTPDRYLQRWPLQAARTTVVTIRAFSNHYQQQQQQQQQQSNHGTQSLMMPVAAALAAAATTTAGTVSCANMDGNTRDSPNHYDRSKDEVLLATATTAAAASMESSSMEWFRVNEDDVDALVELLMADKNVNIAMLPDGLEAQLYKNTVLLTLNAIYSLLKGLQGTKILSHEVHVKALMIDLGGGGSTTTDGGGSTTSPHTRTPSWLVQAVAESTTRPINDQVLQQVAQRLLANPVVNSPWISDALEAQIYTACLQVIFRVTQIILSSIKIRLCGHEIQLSLAFDDGFEKALLKSSENLVHHHPTTRSSSSSTTPKRITMMTPVDLEVLKQLARNCGVGNNNNQDYSWWNRLVTRSNFVEQLHVSLYGLVLGLLDDLFLGQLQIQILSDTIGFDLIPTAAKDSGSPLERTVLPGTNTETNEGPSASTTSSSSTTSQSTTVPLMATSFFLAGIGTGVALSTVLGNQKS